MGSSLDETLKDRVTRPYVDQNSPYAQEWDWTWGADAEGKFIRLEHLGPEKEINIDWTPGRFPLD
jgi:hypothetical protein